MLQTVLGSLMALLLNLLWLLKFHVPVHHSLPTGEILSIPLGLDLHSCLVEEE